jgi:hypothetical protein
MFELMNQLGVTEDDLIIAVIWTIVLLMFLLIFIFVGIQAFSPTSSLSSIINSLLPIGAGITANKTQDKSGNAST